MSSGIYKCGVGFVNSGRMSLEIYKCRWRFINVDGDI